MHPPVLHPSGSFSHTFSFPLFISTYPLIYITANGEDKNNQTKNSTRGQEKKGPNGKSGTSQGCIIPVEKTINTRLLIVALLFLVVYS
jgi:hypothetical protein